MFMRFLELCVVARVGDHLLLIVVGGCLWLLGIIVVFIAH